MFKIIHTIEYRYIIPEDHYFLSHLKYECQKNKHNKMQGNEIFSVLTNRHMFRGYELFIKKEGIKFEYPIINNPMNYLFIIVNVSKLLNKLSIGYDDLSSFKNKYYLVIHERIFNNHNFLNSKVLNRIDYKYDYKCNNQKEKRQLLKILSKARKKKYSAHKSNYNDNENPDTIYYKAKNYKVNTYDKEVELISKGRKQDDCVNVLRYELQILTGLLNSYEKKYGLKRTIDNYWFMREEFFNEYLKPLFYEGDYYSNNIISRLLKSAKNKEILLSKIKQIQESESIDNIYTYQQIKQLQKMNINPLQNNLNLKNPLNIFYKKAV